MLACQAWDLWVWVFGRGTRPENDLAGQNLVGLACWRLAVRREMVTVCIAVWLWPIPGILYGLGNQKPKFQVPTDGLEPATPVPFQGKTLSGTRTSAGRTESGGERLTSHESRVGG